VTDPTSPPPGAWRRTWRCRIRVEFLGHRPDVAEILARAQVFALSSRSESFPLTVLEAMRARLPVIASNVGGISEAVVDGHTGLLVPIGTADAWADSLKHLLVDRETRDSMGANGRDRYPRTPSGTTEC